MRWFGLNKIIMLLSFLCIMLFIVACSQQVEHTPSEAETPEPSTVQVAESEETSASGLLDVSILNLDAEEILIECKKKYPDADRFSEAAISVCLFAAAQEKEDVSVCEQIVDDNTKPKEQCIAELAITTRNVALITQLDWYFFKEYVTTYATRNEDYNSCELIQYSDYSAERYMKECFKSVFSAANAYQTTKCEGVSSTYMASCLEELS